MGAIYSLQGNAAGAVSAVQAVGKAFDETDQAAGRAAKETLKLEQAAKKIQEAVNPQEKYNRLMRELKGHVDAGRLSLADAEKQAARYGAQLQNVSKAGEGAFGNRLTSLLTGATASLGGMSAAVGVVTKGFGELQQAASTAVERGMASLGAFGELQQLGAAGFGRANAIARNLLVSGTVNPDNRAQAASIASDLINAGFSDAESGFITDQLGASRKVAPENLVIVGGQLKKLQNQFGEGDLEGATGRVMAAAAQTQANLAVTAREVNKFAPLAASVGVNMDEALAAFAVSEQRSASPEAAAENLKSLFSQVFRRNLGKGDLQSTLDNISAQAKGDPFSILGDANAVIGFQQLTGGRAQLDSLESQIGGAKFDRADLLSKNPALRAQQLLARAKGGQAVAEADAFETRQALFETVRAAELKNLANTGAGAIRRGALSAFRGIQGLTGDFEGTLAEAAGLRSVVTSQGVQYQDAGQGSAGYIDADTARAIKDLLREQNKLLDGISSNTSKIDRTTKSKRNARGE